MPIWEHVHVSTIAKQRTQKFRVGTLSVTTVRDECVCVCVHLYLFQNSLLADSFLLILIYFLVAGPGRKVKRVSDVNAMGAPLAPAATVPGPYMATPFDAPMQQPYANAGPHQQIDPMYQNVQQQQQFNYSATPQPQIPGPFPGFVDFNQGAMPQQQQQQQPTPNAPFGMFQQPIVQDMAMQYGQRLADQGKQMVESHFEKYVPVTRLKYYFAVDNRYVINKLRLLIFPFTHSDWSLKYDQDNPVQPRFDLNAPDLYIPTMAYITYVVLAGLVLGIQNKFTPEDLGKQASAALAIIVLELCIYSLALYIANIPSTLKTLDLLAYSGYKFSIMVLCIVASILFSTFGYYVALAYSCVPLGFFMVANNNLFFFFILHAN